MTTVIVWVLVLWTGNGPVVIDNIASKENCNGLVAAYRSNTGQGGGQCLPVRKVFVR